MNQGDDVTLVCPDSWVSVNVSDRRYCEVASGEACRVIRVVKDKTWFQRPHRGNNSGFFHYFLSLTYIFMWLQSHSGNMSHPSTKYKLSRNVFRGTVSPFHMEKSQWRWKTGNENERHNHRHDDPWLWTDAARTSSHVTVNFAGAERRLHVEALETPMIFSSVSRLHALAKNRHNNDISASSPESASGSDRRGGAHILCI